MALTLTMRKGHAVLIGTERYEIGTVNNGMDFILKGYNSEFAINCNSWVPIQDKVRVQAGIPRNPAGSLVRLVIDADSAVKILLIK